jgi:hypothetical protein
MHRFSRQIRSMPPSLRVALILAVIVAPPSRAHAQAQAQAHAQARATCCHAEGLAIADAYRMPGLDDRRFNHAEYWAALEPALASDRVGLTPLGESIEGRAINAVTLGSGPTSVLLWSQMHGDESAASMALADITRWWAESPEGDELRATLGGALTITMIPMLNPDGAERFNRHNALGVDVNRDARRLATPEARILKSTRDSLEADFGFNLHDQGTRTAGEDGELVGIALLAPAADEARTWGPVRQRARHLSAVIAKSLEPEIAGRIARYDDTFTPRAFGDNMQKWGTSTVLIESGALAGDPQKQELRRLNVLALLTSFHAIATESWKKTPTAAYDGLPLNRGLTNDLLIRGGSVVMGDGTPRQVDIALIYDDAPAHSGARYGEIGDLDGVEALEEFDATGMFIHPALGESSAILRGEPAELVVRKGRAPDSEVVLRVPAGD